MQLHAQEPARQFVLPQVPDSLTAPQDRAAFLALHYWDNFDFSDTALTAMPEITEQAFVDFISILPYTERAAEAIDTLVCRAAREREMLYHFITLGDKYLYEPNSPMHNEQLHIMMLRSIIGNPLIDDMDKIRPRHLLEIAMRNIPGSKATDFEFTCRDGRRLRLSEICAEYTILYFNDPECEECIRSKSQLALSRIIGRLTESGKVKVVSVCVEGKSAAWEKASYPALWIDGYDEGQQLTLTQAYDLKAMPTLYLLGPECKVILKDASPDSIEQWLSRL